MPRTHRTLLSLLLAWGLTHCAPAPSEAVEAAPAAEQELEAERTSHCPRAYLVEDIHEGPEGSRLQGLLDVDGRLFFWADDGVHGLEPWRSEGSRASTRLIEDTHPGDSGAFPFELEEVRGRVFFVVGRELWRSDGTPGGTRLVTAFPEGSTLSSLMEFRGRLLFAAETPELGRELWISDGTASGTRLWLDINPGPANGFLGDLVEFEGDAVFHAVTGEGEVLRHSLLRVDGRRRVTELYGALGDDETGLFRVTPVGERIFFLVDFSDGRPSLVVSDGTEGGSRLLRDFFDTSTPRGFTDFGGVLFFAADDGGAGTELWRSDGTPEGTVMLKDIRPGEEGSSPGGLTVVHGRLSFAADDGEHGRELWVSDGTEEGTVLAADIRPGPEGSDPLSLVRVNKRLYFSADDGEHGREPWKLDAGRARLVFDIAPGPASSLGTDFSFVRSGDLLYALADDGTHGEELWALPLYPDVCPRGAP